MSEIIDPNDDVYHLLRSVLYGLPPGTAKLERDNKGGRSQLTPTRTGAVGLYGVGHVEVGHVEDCEIGIVEITFPPIFDNRDEAIAFGRAVVCGEIAYTIWRDGAHVVRAQRNNERLPDGGRTVDVMEALARRSGERKISNGSTDQPAIHRLLKY